MALPPSLRVFIHVVPLHFHDTQLHSHKCHSFPPWSAGTVFTGPVLRCKISICSPACADLVTEVRAVCWADPCSHLLITYPSAPFHMARAKMSCCGTRRAVLVACRNVIRQRIQLSPGATQHVSSRITAASNSVCKPTSCRKQALFSPRFLVL